MECKRPGCKRERAGDRWCEQCEEFYARIRAELEAEEGSHFRRSVRNGRRKPPTCGHYECTDYARASGFCGYHEDVMAEA